MVVENIIETAQNEWVAPILFVLKKGRALRFCVGHHKYNAVIKRDLYPISRMDGCIDSFSEEAVFSTIDAISGC